VDGETLSPTINKSVTIRRAGRSENRRTKRFTGTRAYGRERGLRRPAGNENILNVVSIGSLFSLRTYTNRLLPVVNGSQLRCAVSRVCTIFFTRAHDGRSAYTTAYITGARGDDTTFRVGSPVRCFGRIVLFDDELATRRPDGDDAYAADGRRAQRETFNTIYRRVRMYANVCVCVCVLTLVFCNHIDHGERCIDAGLKINARFPRRRKRTTTKGRCGPILNGRQITRTNPTASRCVYSQDVRRDTYGRWLWTTGKRARVNI